MLSFSRFIPAGAGNTDEVPTIIHTYTVYPRWRGEHITVCHVGTVLSGLSPLARGTHRQWPLSAAGERFIPAGAGNTEPTSPITEPTSVYPRWRGEHTLMSAVSASICGLSPLARGTLPLNTMPPVCGRFIPAGAGNTISYLVAHPDHTVYPRWRGEHSREQLENHFVSGLSPLARGTLKTSVENTANDRFIPAGAGNTSPYATMVLS